MSSKFFTPGTIAGLEMRNRLIRSATQDPFGPKDGCATQEQIDLHSEIAASGVPLIITAYAYVSPEGRSTKIQVGFCNEAHYASQKNVLDAVHARGGKMILQLHHAGQAVYFVPKDMEDPAPLSPMDGIEAPNGLLTHGLTEADMERLVQDHVTAALKAKEIGFDGVQLHCAHGYLLSQFLDPNFNQRTDEYGGSAENRFRFIRRILVAIREAVGSEYPVLAKVNTNCAGEADEAYAQDILYFCKEFEACGANAIELSGFDWIGQGKSKNHNYYLERAKAVHALVNIPLILVGGVRNLEDIEAVMEAGIDFISMSRPFINQPDFLKHLEAGEASPCISCTKCLTLYAKEGRRCILHEKPEETTA
ncbi:MAG: NADH-dependent flavin oxidoreductase, Oye family [Firmicutes bacterium]|nr:NADH-dependent flavin oxidoreductase, Oye family [Bacillota bacterium]